MSSAMMYRYGPWMHEPGTEIPPELLALDFDALAARIEATGDQTGHELVAAQRERVSHATCTPCARNAATATLRVWLSKRENDNA